MIQRCLHHLSSKDNQFIIDAVSKHCVSVATHKHGCCVLQRTIDYATTPQRKQLVQEIVANALELVQDAFGNYVVQYVLDLGEPSIAHGILQNLLGHISALSVQKFSSNVIEKLLELSSDKLRAKIIDELISPERLPRLLQDPYANYVIQKALGVSKKAQFERLVAIIKPHLLALRNTNFGKRIQSKILKKFPDLNLGAGQFDASAGAAAEAATNGGEMNPQLLNAMVSGLTGSPGKRMGAANGGVSNGVAGADGVSGAPGGLNPLGSLSPLSPGLQDPMLYLGDESDAAARPSSTAQGEPSPDPAAQGETEPDANANAPSDTADSQ